MLLFLDGMAHYDTARIGMKYSTVDSLNCTWSVTAEGRAGKCIKRVATTNGTGGYLAISPLTSRLGAWTPTASGVCGFAVKIDDLDMVTESVVMPSTFLHIFEGSDYHLRVTLNANGTFNLIQRWQGEGGEGPRVLAVSTEGLTEGTWAYVEFKWLIHATAGTFEIRVNGVPVMTYSGPTREDVFVWNSLAVWNGVRLFSLASNPSPAPLLTLRMCDLYLADLTAPATADVHDFLGDGMVTTIMPNGVGASSGWTPIGAAANWDTQNDLPAPDDDTTYVHGTTPGTLDLYQFEDIPAGSVIRGMQVCVMARKADVGTATLAPVVRPGATPQLGPTQGVSSAAYDRFLTQPWDLNPDSGVAWTPTDINSGQFGVQKIT